MNKRWGVLTAVLTAAPPCVTLRVGRDTYRVEAVRKIDAKAPTLRRHEDREASRFRSMFDDHWDPVLRYLARRTSTDLAEDLAADVFTIAWERFDVVPDGHELPWLYATARNVLLNSRRRQWRTIPVAELPERDGSSSRDGEVDLAHDVAQALTLLSDSDREVIALTVWEHLSAEEAATVLGCRPGTYRVRLHRARRRLDAALRRTPRSARLDPRAAGVQEGA